MAQAWRYAATAAFTILVIAAGILHGQHTFRWEAKPPLDAYVERMKAVPISFENWVGEDLPKFTDDLKAHGIEDYIYRIYKNRGSTESYRVLLVVGRPGPIAAHTPDVCNRGAGYTAIGDQKRADIHGLDAHGAKDGRIYQMWSMKFKPPITRAADALDQDFRWAWMAPGKTIQAPEVARYEFASQPALYKIYVIHDQPSSQAVTSAPTATPSVATPSHAGTVHEPTKFLQTFLPKVEAALKDPGPAK